jgi:hypothetical protein
MRLFLRILAGLGVLLLLAAIFVWSVLALPFFSEFRRTLVSDFLTDQIGQPVIVKGDVRAVIAPIARIHSSQVEIPSTDIDGTNVAQLASLDFEVDLIALLGGRLDLDNLMVDGLQVALIRLEDQSTSWKERRPGTPPPTSAETETGARPAPAPARGRLIEFLSTRTVAFTGISLLIDDRFSGFRFDFELSEFLMEQLDRGQRLQVTGRGKVNEEPFNLDATFPEADQFGVSATFSSVTLGLEGDPIPAAEGGGFTGTLGLDIAALGDLLDLVELERVLEGSATLEMALRGQGGVLSISDLNNQIAFEDGQLITLTGKVDDLAKLAGIEVAFNARLHPVGSPPAPAASLKDLKLTEIDARILGRPDELEFEELRFVTNAFEQGLEEVGPVSIGRIWRTPEDRLALQDIAIQAGPLDAPLLTATGNIRNALQLKDLDFAGQFDAPATLVLKGLSASDAAAFGGVEVTFEVDDAPGHLAVHALTAKAVGTEIWSLDADLTLGDVASLDGLAVDLDLGVADGASFFSALNLTPVQTGPLSVTASLRGEDATWNGAFGLGAGSSKIDTTVDMGKTEGRNTVRAAMVSESLQIADLRNAIAGVVELGKIGKTAGDGPGAEEVELQPLVLPGEDPEEDRPELQPLVLPEDAIAGTGGETADDGRPELQPLVLPPESMEIVSLEDFLRQTDIYADIDFKRISGIQGVTRLSSELVSEGGKARLGPVEFNYGQGYFNFRAAMDVLEAPDVVSVAGATSGWDLADILQMAGVDFQANGALRGDFNLTGNISSAAAFASSMSGTASLVMLNGQIATSLLELAGLGIFPWLFSRELRQGYTNVVCVVAPVNIRAGTLSFDQVVAETESVQLWARGSVDVKNDRIALRAEPRPVGRPLARSAWPFEVTGPLSNPQFKLDIGGSRSRRADGATQMPADRQPCRPDIFQLQ